MRFTLKALILITTIFAIVAFLLGRLNRRLDAIPKPIQQSFSSWQSPLTTPPMASGEYWIIIDYARSEGGRLYEPLQFTLRDTTENLIVATDSQLVGAAQLGGAREGEIVGEFRAVEGHCYTIDVDAAQVEELARYQHPRLLVSLTDSEISNRIGHALGFSTSEPEDNE